MKNTNSYHAALSQMTERPATINQACSVCRQWFPITETTKPGDVCKSCAGKYKISDVVEVITPDETIRGTVVSTNGTLFRLRLSDGTTRDFNSTSHTYSSTRVVEPGRAHLDAALNGVHDFRLFR